MLEHTLGPAGIERVGFQVQGLGVAVQQLDGKPAALDAFPGLGQQVATLVQGDDTPARRDPLGQGDRVLARAGSDVEHASAGAQAEKRVAALLVGPRLGLDLFDEAGVPRGAPARVDVAHVRHGLALGHFERPAGC
jgi:hypothetical protein